MRREMIPAIFVACLLARICQGQMTLDFKPESEHDVLFSVYLHDPSEDLPDTLVSAYPENLNLDISSDLIVKEAFDVVDSTGRILSSKLHAIILKESLIMQAFGSVAYSAVGLPGTRIDISALKAANQGIYYARRYWYALSDSSAWIICTPDRLIGVNVSCTKWIDTLTPFQGEIDR